LVLWKIEGYCPGNIDLFLVEGLRLPDSELEVRSLKMIVKRDAALGVEIQVIMHLVALLQIWIGCFITLF
jgi:hypothetical protein